MAISHLCLACGLDLARVRPAPEPYYGLQLVRCPGCGTACVRRRLPADRAWRSFLRLKTSIGMAVLQVGTMVFLASVTLALADTLGRAMWIMGGGLGPERVWASPIWPQWTGVVIVGVATGAWLAAGLRHWRPWASWLAWAAVMAALTALVQLADPMLDVAASWPEDTPGFDARHVARFRYAMLVVGAVLAWAIVGLPVGGVIVRVHRWFVRARWRARRARLRTRRQGR